MAQEFTPILENDIGALAPDRTPAKVRAIDDQGRSINLTPTQTSALVLTPANKPRIQELAGIDYSLETEQEVPGEFWIDANGAKKQVYVQTFRASTSAGHVLRYGVSSILSATGYVAVGSAADRYQANIFDYLKIYSNDLRELCAIRKGGATFDFCITIKFTKA